jgi:cytochrome b subunit of formate dehydrogenase
MDFVRWGTNPWGQRVLEHVSWDLLWAALFAGLAFLVAHASYMVLSAHRKRDAAETDAMEAARRDLPAKIQRHSLAARLFHWVMASSMLTLLFTAFLPVLGVRFAWVQWHWIAGVVLTGAILFHVIHASFWLDFWSIWVGPKDIPEFKAEVLRELGHEVPGPKPGKYPLGNRLYHQAIVVAGLSAIATGVFMMSRVRTPFFNRNPYLFSDTTWGFMYVLHGLAGVGLVGLVIAHVYFAVRPDKWWITKSMILGWITRRQYLEHHDPHRWAVGSDTTPQGSVRPSTGSGRPEPAEGRL